MTKKNTSGRGLTVRVKTAKKRSTSSTQWLKRQLNDPYVRRAKADGYRSRAAYKILELDEKFHFLKKGMKVVDLGAAPGGWTQVLCQRGISVVGIDLLEIPPIPGSTLLQMDFMDEDAPARLKQELGGEADLVLSDMAPNACGDPKLDHLRIVTLVEAAFDFACEVLKPGGGFIAKNWQGGTEAELLGRIKQRFTTVKHAKPKSSRSDSAETFLVAIGFRS